MKEHEILKDPINEKILFLFEGQMKMSAQVQSILNILERCVSDLSEYKEVSNKKHSELLTLIQTNSQRIKMIEQKPKNKNL